MSKFEDTRGQRRLPVGLCSRCHEKFPIDELSPDPNAPGLHVCAADRDKFDPWRLPAPAVEKIAVPDARPDEAVTATHAISVRADGSVIPASFPTKTAVFPDAGNASA